MSRFGNRLEDRFIREAITPDLLENIVDWITDNLSPEDMFSEKQLEEWAEENGFTRIN